MASEPIKPSQRTDSAQTAPSTTDGGIPPSVPKTGRLFRGIDWLSFLLTAVLVFAGYMYTLAPDLTLEDSGELAVASQYAGVPHPPGYPVWTIYTWVFTKIIPFGNIAWRVGVSSAFAGALACGLIALMVSRGSSMLVESIADFKGIARRTENWICLVTGFVSGMLIGFNGFMWSQAVIVEVYTLSMLSLVGVLACMLRWAHGPHQYRYLYLAWFLAGIAFNNHQSLLVIAIAMVAMTAFVQLKAGREFFFFSALAYLLGIVLQIKGKISLLDNITIALVFHAIGLSLIGGWIFLAVKTKLRAIEFARNWIVIAMIGAFLGILAWLNDRISTGLGVLSVGGFLATIVGYFLMRPHTIALGRQWFATLMSGVTFVLGIAFYLYMPFAGATNPPLNWGYPRTVGGFVHAFTRGQYERIHPTAEVGRYFQQVWYILIEGPLEEFNLIYVLFAFIPLFFIRRVQPRERAWLVGLVAFYIVLGPFLLELFNPAPDRQSLSLNKPFFIASHVIIAMLIGYGLTLLLTSLITASEKLLKPLLGLTGGLVLCGLVTLTITIVNMVRSDSFNWITLLITLVPLLLAGVGLIVVLLGSGAEATADFKYRRVRAAMMGLLIGICGFAVYHVITTYLHTPYSVLRMTAVTGLVLGFLALAVMVLAREKAPVTALVAILFLMPLYPIFGHWSENEQRDHYFGYWFGHDMFTPPYRGKDGKLKYDRKEREELLKTPEGQKRVYPEMTRDAILFGGTDPGRFCPTYMIFSESFTDAKDKPRDPDFDRRDVYIITQNALADGTYLQYIRAHFYRSDEYRYDTPFFNELLRSEKERQNDFKTNLLARMIAVPLDKLCTETIGDNIEKERRAGSSFFKPDHFKDLASFAKKLEQGGAPAELSTYLRERLSENTRKMLASPGPQLASALAQDLNKLLDDELDGTQELPKLKAELPMVEGQLSVTTKDKEKKKLEALKQEITKKIAYYTPIVPLYTPSRFQGISFSPYMQAFIKQNPQYHSRIRMNRLLLEGAYPELTKSPGGVYPDKEIYTPTPEDSQKCFQEYMADAQRRMQMTPPQLKPGEDVRIEGGRVQVSGQVAVMAINGLLTKVIFDHNPDHEFFVEESFPLDWMYPHLTPFGIIMKINREPLRELSQEIVDKDHRFWSDYAERLIGTNVITYDTPLKDIAAFCERVYVNRDYSNFKGDRRFVRDDDGQKAFSKLRSSIAGVYQWRLNTSRPGTPEYDRMFREAEFAFKQAFAFCPYSPEALYRYVNLLATARRFDDALLLAKTSQKLDPGNAQLTRLVDELGKLRDANTPGAALPANPALQKAEADYKANKGNFNLAVAYAQEAAKAGDVARVVQVADDLVANPTSDATAIQFAMQIYTQPQVNDLNKLEKALLRWTVISPTAEAWVDLAGAQAVLNKQAEALASLKRSVDLSNARLKTDPKASNIVLTIQNDQRFASLRALPEFQALLKSNQ